MTSSGICTSSIRHGCHDQAHTVHIDVTQCNSVQSWLNESNQAADSQLINSIPLSHDSEEDLLEGDLLQGYLLEEGLLEGGLSYSPDIRLTSDTISAARGRIRAQNNHKKRQRNSYINKAFDELKSRIPNLPKDVKLSKIMILKQAIEYIRHLENMLKTEATREPGERPTETWQGVDLCTAQEQLSKPLRGGKETEFRTERKIFVTKQRRSKVQVHQEISRYNQVIESRRAKVNSYDHEKSFHDEFLQDNGHQ